MRDDKYWHKVIFLIVLSSIPVLSRPLIDQVLHLLQFTLVFFTHGLSFRDVVMNLQHDTMQENNRFRKV